MHGRGRCLRALPLLGTKLSLTCRFKHDLVAKECCASFLNVCHTLLPGFDGLVPRPNKTHDEAIHQKGHSGAGGRLLVLLAVLFEEVVASQTH